VPLVGHHETGLIGIALDPHYEANGFIYAYYTAGTAEADFKNRVVRVQRDGENSETILDNLPAGIIHNGGILAFGPDDNLYIGVGVNNVDKEKAQDIHYLGGKVLRVTVNGSIPKDNPFPNSPVYSYGHRNIFGMAFHPKTGKLYICDVGPDHDDEINIIAPGGNYGWPQVMGRSDNPDWMNPIKTYTPTMTPTQCTFVGNDFYFGSYNEGTVHKLTLRGQNFDEVVKDEIVYQDKPFGVIGVFADFKQNLYVTLPTSFTQFVPKEIKEVR
jgi:quinoprotein glucose dehydrogenase